MTRSSSSMCYFLVCFNSVEFVSYLLASIYRDQDVFIVHCDKKAPAKLRSFLNRASKEYKNIVLMESKDYSWAGFSHVQISLDAIFAGIQLSQHWEHFIFLSEQHLPLKSPDEIADYLQNFESIASFTAAKHLGKSGQSDLSNRFEAEYRELPGVGCFATSLANRNSCFLEKLYHGSNWIVLHRKHCRTLIAAERIGLFNNFKTCVHPEETAIPSILKQFTDSIHHFDSTLVAFSHLTDNDSLVMSDDLFMSSIEKDYLFIRKRTRELNPQIDGKIRQSHFIENLYKIKDGIDNYASESPKLNRIIVDKIISKIVILYGRKLKLRFIDPDEHDFVPRVYIVAETSSMSLGIDVRILSENLQDFKICITRNDIFDGNFKPIRVENDILYSTIRSRVFDLFAKTEILPLHLSSAGFLSNLGRDAADKVASLAIDFVLAAEKIH